MQVEAIFVAAIAELTAGKNEAALGKSEAALSGWQELQDEGLTKLTTDLIDSLKDRIERARKAAEAKLEAERMAQQAESIFEEAKKLHDGTAEQKAEAAVKFEQARLLFRQAGRGRREIESLLWLGIVTDLKESRINRTVNKTEAHLYNIDLKRGELLNVTLERQGDFETALVIMDADRNILKVSIEKRLFYMAERTDKLLLGVISDGKQVTGSYVLQSNAPFADDKEKQTAADDLFASGRRFFVNKKDYQLAVLYFEHARKLYSEVPKSASLGHTLDWLGSSYSELRQYEKAIGFYRDALEIFRGLGNKIVEGNGLEHIGLVYQQMDQPIRAVEYFGQSLAIMREQKDRKEEGEALARLGFIYHLIGQGSDALEHYEQMLIISREIKNLRDELIAVAGMGAANQQLSRYEKAQQFEAERLRIALELKDRESEADSYAQIAINHGYLRQYDKSLEYAEKALAIYREKEILSGEATMRITIGVTYGSIGSYKRAEEYLTQSLELSRRIKSRHNEGASLGHLGIIYIGMGQFDKAAAHFEQALPIFRELKDGTFIAGSLRQYGRALLEQKQLDRSLSLHNEALSLSQSLKDRHAEAWTLSGIGDIHLAQNRLDIAATHFEKALAIFREIKDPRGESNALNGLMNVWNQRGKRSLAVFYGKQSVNLLQTMRRSIVKFEAEVQTDFVKDNEKIYRRLAEILIASGRLAEAEQVTNLLKQEEYFAYLRRDPSSAAALTKDTDFNEKEKEVLRLYTEKTASITRLGREYEEEKARVPQNQQRLALLENDINKAVEEFQKFLEDLVNKFPETKAGGEQKARVEESTAFMTTLGELGRLTNQPGRVAAVYTIVGTDQLSLIVVTSQVRDFRVVPIKDTELNTLIGEFRTALQDPRIDPRIAGAKLYETVFKPIEELILPLTLNEKGEEEVTTIMWSLDGSLRYVPIAALYDPVRQKYLAQRFLNTIFTPKSINVLERAPSANWRALGLGVSEKRTESGEDFSSLPAVLQELGIIGDETNTIPNSILTGKVLKDKDFTKDAMKTELRRLRPLVHIASHFSFKPTGDSESFLLLGEGKFTQSEMQKSGQIFDRVELLTLSACNTAVGGHDANGKEIDGFGMFAQERGAQSVLATLWAVADESTSLFMSDFYRRKMGDSSLSKSSAIRQAQLDMIEGRLRSSGTSTGCRAQIYGEGSPATFKCDPNAPFTHPYFWAPFVLIGNWR